MDEFNLTIILNNESEISNYIKKKTIFFMSNPNVYPGPLRSVKQPGKAKTAKFLQKLRFIRKTQFYKDRYFHIFLYIFAYISTCRAESYDITELLCVRALVQHAVTQPCRRQVRG